jgi:putative DNA primase/helicase
MLEHAIAYARAGLPVIPLHGILEDSSCTCGKERCHSPGKHPRTRNGLKDATTDLKQIEKWWGDTRWPNASIGGVGGRYLCLDIDAKADGFKSLERLIEAHASLPDTAVVETGEYEGQRGKHYWFRVPDDHEMPGTRAGVRTGIDIRCAGGYAVLPPSPHASGVEYEWIVGSIDKAAEAPSWVLELVPEYVEGDSTWTPDPNFRMSKQIKQFLSGELEVEVGEQRDFLVAAARSVLATGRNVDMTAQLLWEGTDGNGGIENCEWGDDPWTPEEIYALVSDIYDKPPTSPLEKDFSGEEYTYDDAGNAQRLIASFKEGHALHIPEIDRWYIWHEDRDMFVPDTGAWMRLRWIDIASELGKQAAVARSEGEAKALMQHAKTSRMRPRVDAAVNMGADIVQTPMHELDRDPLMFGVQNGVIDLKDGTLYENSPEDLITQRSPVEYNDRAKSKLFEQFLRRTVPDDELRDFLQLAVGYTLTGITDEHAFFYVYGRPASGKTTILEAVKHVMGTYGIKAQTTTFIRQSQRSGSGPTEDLARLAGKRFVYTTEVEKDERLAVALVSELTGGESMAARFLHNPTFEFKPRLKLWIGANDLPRVPGSQRSGLWRRIKVLPFDEPLSHEERDPLLARKLREPEETQAILAWAVEGASLWYERYSKHEPLIEPEIVQQETAKYERESDHVNAFITDAIEKTEDAKHRVPIADLFAHYQRWCDLEGRQQRRTQQQLARSLSDTGYVAKPARHDGKTQRCWIGVRLRHLETSHGINIKGAKKR